MREDALLRDLILTYAVALAAIVGLSRLRVPPVVAMILAGAVAGPTGIGIVRSQEDVQTLAEIGIVLLLFTVGLDFSVADFRLVWRRVIGGGVLQIAGTAVAVVGLLLVATGRSARVSLFIGLFVALSSTAIVLKELSARNQLDAPHGRLMVGLLLFQDLCVVALLLLVPLLSGDTPLSAVPLVLGRAALAIGVVAAVSRIVLPALLGAVAASGRREAFSLAVVLASVGTAWMSSWLGISMALGAFLGGLILGESEFSHQAHAEIRPVRDLLAGLFFISLGMLLDLGFLAGRVPVVAALTMLIVLLKAIAAAVALAIAATPLRVAIAAGIGIAQVGEFSFILGRSGLDAGLLSEGDWQLLLGASITTMMLTPSLLSAAEPIAHRLAKSAGRPTARTESEIPRLSDHVVILGFGVGGQLVARALRDLGTPYLVVDLNGTTVRQARQRQESIFFGDATSPDALVSAGVERARAVVVVLSDPNAAELVVKTVRAISPTVAIIVRARYRLEAETLLRLGANIAVAEELEASLEVLAQLLAILKVPGNAVEVLLEGFRRMTSTARPVRAATRPLEDLPREIGTAPIATHQLQPGEWAIGRTLAEINLRAETGALVIAARHGAQNLPSPPIDLQLSEGDVLYLMGDHTDVSRARHRLTNG
jgi:CPA2 family monovalent cation:H+ antiporter-2